MPRPALEVADILRDHGAAWRRANASHVSLGQMKVMSAIERCRTAALGGHVARCENQKCAHTIIAYNSCRNRHCPKCQGAAAREWLAEREAELLPVPYFHVVYTLPAAIADIAYQNKAVIYDLLFKASAETTLKIAADPKHLGARIGFMSVLHTWGSALTHHPHVHMVVPGGGLSPDGSKWIACRPRYFLTVEVLTSATRADHRRSWCREGENPTSKFQKGQKRPPGAGRKPGQPNLVTRDIKGGCLYLPEAVYEALREAAFRERRKIHDIVLEGIEMALSKRGWKVSAPRRDQ